MAAGQGGRPSETPWLSHTSLRTSSTEAGVTAHSSACRGQSSGSVQSLLLTGGQVAEPPMQRQSPPCSGRAGPDLQLQAPSPLQPPVLPRSCHSGSGSAGLRCRQVQGEAFLCPGTVRGSETQPQPREALKAEGRKASPEGC